jgi:hypothetical protein
MFSKNMKILIPVIVGILIVVVYIKFINSLDLAIKYSFFPLILAFLFYYDITIAFIATVIFSVIFIYNMQHSKKVNYRKKTSKFKINDTIDHEFDYVNSEQNNEYTNNETDDVINSTTVVEGMSNKRFNRGVDKIDVEQNIRSKESNTLLISKNFHSNGNPEPVSVGKDGIMSGYTMMNSY